jgi:transcriptional regulator with XRE-family HTH domain
VDKKAFLLALGTRIRDLRQQVPLTQEALAERAGISNEVLSKIERGVNSPSVFTLKRIADGLSLPFHVVTNLSSPDLADTPRTIEAGELRELLEEGGPEAERMVADLVRFIRRMARGVKGPF